jgi:excisionase family DNA binding protein
MGTAVDRSRRRRDAQGIPDLIPVSQAVAEFGVSRSTLYELMKAGHLHRYRRVGERRTLIDQREVKRLLRPRRVR